MLGEKMPMDNMIIRVLTRIFDFILLNILWVVCSIPIVTMGASTAALYSVMLKITKNQDGYIIKDYFKAFCENFRQGTIVWMILALLGSLIGADMAIVSRTSGIVASAAIVLFCITGFFCFVEVLFVFPLIAVFRNSTGNMMKNAILIPVSRLPYALPVLLLTGMCLILTFLNQTSILAGAAIWSVIGVSVLTYANSFFIRKVLEPYMEAR
ncbi:YesL family protein [[Clostridium] scindens]|nr:DUF624 domain-containing protein [[Clostridium] scindens]